VKPVSTALADFLFEAANFLLLAAALGWLMFKPVRRALDAERERHDKDVEETKRLRAEAESLASAARAAQEAAAHDAEEHRRESLEGARREAAEIVGSARKAQRADRQHFEHELALQRDAEATALAEAIARIAAESVRTLLLSLDGPGLDAALVRAALTQLDSLPQEARSAAVVECARPLDGESRVLLQRILGEHFQERIVAELGAGLRVTTAQGQVDASALSFARRAALAMKSAVGSPAIGAEVNDA
jgi:F0F1-type ATP synthase membrane subunit b/b'